MKKKIHIPVMAFTATLMVFGLTMLFSGCSKEENRTTTVGTAKVTVTFNDSDGATIVAVKGLPGASLSAPPNPVKKGFTFTGWSQSVPETFPGESVVMTAQWKKVRKGFMMMVY